MALTANLVNTLWLAHPVLETGVVAIMVRHKLYRSFPLFFTYVVAQIAIFAVVFPVYVYASASKVYFGVYWGTTALSIVLGFRVLHEIFLDIFRQYHTLRDLGSVLFKWAGLVMLLVGVVVAASAPADSDPVVQAVLTLQRTMRVVQVGLVLFLLVFSRYLGISWRQRAFGIAMGFGSFALVELILIALAASHSGFLSSDRMGVLNEAAYNFSLLVWFGYMSKGTLRENITVKLQTQRWEQSLNEIQHPHAPESLIPMFETMVERALSRAHNDPASLDDEEVTTSVDRVRVASSFFRRQGRK